MTTELVHRTFLGIDPAECELADARVALVPVPYDGTASYMPGARLGPEAIISASSQVELWDLELEREPWRVGIHALSPLSPRVAGPEAMAAAVEGVVGDLLGLGKLPFTLGGEHSVALGAARAVKRAQGRRPVTHLVLDAHLDLRDSYEGSRYSHACVSRRLLELGKVVHVGARVACPEELDAVRSHDLDPIWGHELHARPRERWVDRALAQLGERVYVSVDVDGLDPAVIPATGTPVPGGLGWYDTLALLRRVGQERQIVGCDLCELAPGPGQHGSCYAAASLAYKMIGYFVG